MKVVYHQWLQSQKYQERTIGSRISNVRRVEQFYGNLDDHYDKDRMASLLETLNYSRYDEGHKRPNPSKIPINGNIHDGLQTLSSAVRLYMEFRNAGEYGVEAPAPQGARPENAETISLETNQGADIERDREVVLRNEEEVGQRIGLERDMQVALRLDSERLEPGLTIIDSGVERSVDSGFIDITARDASGTTVVIELKAGTAGQRAVAQILSYMGDIAAGDDSGIVRGILVASDFDAKAKSAARMVPTLTLRKYSVRFVFSDGHA